MRSSRDKTMKIMAQAFLYLAKTLALTLLVIGGAKLMADDGAWINYIIIGGASIIAIEIPKLQSVRDYFC